MQQAEPYALACVNCQTYGAQDVNGDAYLAGPEVKILGRLGKQLECRDAGGGAQMALEIRNIVIGEHR